MTIFVLISGFGFGNASRQIALIESILERQQDVKIYVYSWGNGSAFLEKFAHFESVQIKKLFYFIPRMSLSYVLQLTLTTALFILFYPFNSIYLFFERLKLRPDKIIFDSDYHYFSFLGGKNIIRYSVNQVPIIIEKSRFFPLSFIWKNGFIISFFFETIDYWIQSFFVDAFLCPSFKKESIKNPKIKIFSPIVRRSFRTRSYEKNPFMKPAIMMGGSGIEQTLLRHWATKMNFSILQSSGSVFFDAQTELNKYNPIVTQGGLSSLSEAVSLRKALWVYPLRGHWEQYLNCLELQKLGLARMIQAFNQVPEVYNVPTEIQCLGADEIANFLLTSSARSC